LSAAQKANIGRILGEHDVSVTESSSFQYWSDQIFRGIKPSTAETQVDDRLITNEFVSSLECFIFKTLDSAQVFTTAGGLQGLGLNGMWRKNLMIYVVKGCKFPMLLERKETKPGEYKYIGPCFLLNFMDGQAAELVAKGEAVVEEVVIY
jgi:hypothetical protein